MSDQAQDTENRQEDGQVVPSDGSERLTEAIPPAAGDDGVGGGETPQGAGKPNTDEVSLDNEFDKSKTGTSGETGCPSDKDENRRQMDYGMSLLQDNIYFDNNVQIKPELINSLTDGFAEKFLPSLEANRKTIAQIKDSQMVLIETVQQENAKFKDCQALEGLDKMMTKAKLYHAKLLKLRRDMTALHDKSAKLKRRALRLQQQKQKEELTRAQQMELEYEKEKMLTARVASSSPTATPDASTLFS